jgi:hypothetical protein
MKTKYQDILWELVKVFPFEKRYFEGDILKNYSKAKDFAYDAAVFTQLRFILPKHLPRVLNFFSKDSNTVGVLKLLSVFEKAGLELFASSLEKQKVFKRLISKPILDEGEEAEGEENQTPLSLAGWFFTGQDDAFTEQLIQIANTHKTFSLLRLILMSKISYEKHSEDILRWIYEEKILVKNASLSQDLPMLCLVKFLTSINLDANHIEVVKNCFEHLVESSIYLVNERILMKKLVLAELADSELYENLKEIDLDDNHYSESLSFLLCKRWQQLNQENAKKLAIEKLLVLDADYLVCWMPVICKALENDGENPELEVLLVEVVSCGVYREDVLCVAQNIQNLRLSQVSRAQIAAHWFLVDTMTDFCECYSLPVFLRLIQAVDT